MKIKTWQMEAGVVAAVLAATVFISGNTMKEWIGAAAVLFTFMHAQVAERMAAQQAKMATPSVPCHGRTAVYFTAKEVLWLVYFVMSQTWAALAGVVIFLLYPLWRKHYTSKIN